MAMPGGTNYGRLEVLAQGQDGRQQHAGFRVSRPQGQVLEQSRATDLAEVRDLVGTRGIFLHGW